MPRSRIESEVALAMLEADELIGRAGGAENAPYRTTARWQGAMARAAWSLVRAGDRGDDLRAPIAMALLEIYGDTQPDEVLAAMIEVLVPIEIAEIDPRAHLANANAQKTGT